MRGREAFYNQQFLGYGSFYINMSAAFLRKWMCNYKKILWIFVTKQEFLASKNIKNTVLSTMTIQDILNKR